MKKKVLIGGFVLTALTVFVFAAALWNRGPELIGENENEEHDMYDGPEMIARQEFERTKDLSTGTVPRERLLEAMNKTTESKDEVIRRFSSKRMPGDGSDAPTALSWIERGPTSDTVGPSNGNSRANSGLASGRIRSILVDANDATGKTVFVGGVAGGLWKTTDITVASPTWTLVNDFFSNMAVAEIAQQPGSPNIMYFATGESFGNGDAVRGNGVFKSIDGGATWTYLPTTSTFTNGTRILVDTLGNVYLGTQGAGLRRSIDGGTTWTNITPAGLPNDICDIELSSTGRLHVVTGIFSTQAYRFTDTPATVAAATWTAPTVAFPSFAMRAEIAVNGSTLYAAPANASYQVPTIYKSTDGGANWAATAGQPAGSWANGQGWYSLSMGINSANANEVVVGGLDTYRSLDGGATWTKISAWVGTGGSTQYVHADQHKVVWYNDGAGGTRLLFGSDGGIFYSTDSGTTIRDRNNGLRIKQFYSVAIHPTLTNYFLAGAQDNGNHQFSNAGLSTSVEVTGGDGAYVAIDQDQPQFQFGAYVFNQYRRSTNSGASWSSVNLNTGTGQFINPFDYDNTANIMYCGDNPSSYRRWTDPQTGSASAVVNVSNMAGSVTAVAVSPFTANKVFFGTSSGKVVRVDSANTFVSGTAGVDLSTGLPGGTVSNISFGTTESNLIMCQSNYGINNVFVSTDGGTTWTASDGNLPDMPVRWTMFKPGDNTKAFIATETGVWETTLLAGGATVWTANPTFPTVRTDMIKYRVVDGLIAAATHGRGLWSTAVPTAANVSISGRVLTTDGRGLRNAVITITDQSGNARNVMTGPMGTYRFDDLATGATYVISVRSRRFSYEPRVIALTDELTGYDITPSGTGRGESVNIVQPTKLLARKK
jgi:hypothetical protein